MSFRLHPRTLEVNQAESEIGNILVHWEDPEIRDTHDRLLALTEYQHDLCNRLVGLPARPGGNYPRFCRMLAECQTDFDLTDAEMLQFVAAQVLSSSRYVLRDERFPGRPNARADVHPDDQDD